MEEARALDEYFGLSPYGIQNDQSDWRAHVGVLNQAIYWFRTAVGAAAAQLHGRLISINQPGVDGVAATGWMTDMPRIEGLIVMPFPEWPHWGRFDQRASTSTKGDLAFQCVMDLERQRGIAARQVVDLAEQIAGFDFVLPNGERVQVKCDWRAGDPPKGSGSLCLQRSERNPLGRH
jgi:hypothetical protein